MAGVGNDASQIEEFLSQQGLSSAQIAGIMGNLTVESGNGKDPNTISHTAYGIDTNGLPSGGIAQWNGPRLRAEEAYVASVGGSGMGTVQQQLSYLWQELNSPTYKSTVLTPIEKTQSASTAATIWDQKYEVSSPVTLPQRVALAKEIDSGWSGAGGAFGNAAGDLGAGNFAGAAGQTVSGAVQSIPGIHDLTSFFEWIGDAQNLLRVGYFVVGAAMVIVGAGKLIGSNPAGAIGNAAKAGARAVAAPEIAAVKAKAGAGKAKLANRQAFKLKQKP